MSKSAIYTVNTTVQAVEVGDTINLGSIVRRYGCAANLLNNAIVIDEVGYYDIAVSITVEPNDIGTVTVSLLNNGEAIPGAIASSSVTVAEAPTSLAFESIVRIFCGAKGVLTLALTGTDSNITNVAFVVKKM